MSAPAFRHDMPFGANLLENGGTRFALWAPDVGALTLELVDGDAAHGLAVTHAAPMTAVGDGWWTAEVSHAGPGTLYRYRLPDGLAVPDPASRLQPYDVHGPSRVIDPAAFPWQTEGWRGRPWHEAVIYELHPGTFSPEGTFAGIEAHLDHLAALGITAVELMPVADFPGRWNWGYDGVALFAPDSRYGTPDDLKRLIDAAHARGLMVFLDVVYNHFGPEGNYLHCYAKSFFDEAQHTPWGAAIDFSRPQVREFYVHNTLYWLEEYRFDGLRFDAVHAIADHQSEHILDEIARRVRAHFAGSDRHVHLVLENDDNAVRFLDRPGTRFDAQWNDDYHHILHHLLTGEAHGYYADHATDPMDRLARVLTRGFDYQGDVSPFRDGRTRGESSAHLPPTAFVDFIQNHDQVGNRALGERLTALAPKPAVEAALVLLLLAPRPPLLFMGEEWGCERPFLFHVDFGEDLREPVREGRRGEFASFPGFSDPAARARIPDPFAMETFTASRLDWSSLEAGPHAAHLRWIKGLLATRHAAITPLIPTLRPASAERFGARGLRVTWQDQAGSGLVVVMNLGPDPVEAPVPDRPTGPALAATPADARAALRDAATLPPWTVIWARGD
ncbi:malto-oligosyltrehalose trehalohydrolase [Rhodospira trueperi]|uniref:Malto-oligosyltrehalose trehalohydrolase n=1 Tax=Rhodospira trueperi TaxID=69960 RepID=A0A1G6YZR1_9PROT|nr:malto-oligosyltrehalose trehalohydrolase [Rhodospira trueperi]SDD95994.1 1,4-alpha-glucan branching enzyme/maltooligosyltrehalose trehalohydrolase [Rhodospira trueperi]